MSMSGKAKGENFINDYKYILYEEGIQGIKKVEDELERLNVPLKYKRIKSVQYYPIGLRVISLLAIKQALRWQDKDIVDLGRYVIVGAPLLIRIYSKFFHSMSQSAKMAPRIWRDYFTEGELEVVGYDEKEKWASLSIINFDVDPVFCRVLEGHFSGLLKLILGTKRIVAKETECTFQGGTNHNFFIKGEND